MSLNPRITDWKGLTVWLVGASSGIGHATAELLHARGARVVVSARNAAAIAAFESAHPGSLGMALDATDRDAMRAAALRIVERFGRIDLAVYCAGYYKAMRATSFDLDDALRWSYTLRLPVDGSVYEVQFDDWMYLMDQRVLLNKAVMSKFGIRLGEVTLAFSKP